MVHTYDRMIRTAGRNQENDERPTTDSMTRILLLDEPTGRCHQNPFVGALSIYGPYTHLHTYAFSSPYAGTYTCIHTYIRLLLPSKYAFSWLLYIHTWRNVVGLWPMFDVLRAYVHTYIHMHTDTHFAIRRVCTYISLHAHIHICVCVWKATCVALTTFGIPTRAYSHS